MDIYPADFTDTSVPVEKNTQALIIFFFRKKGKAKPKFMLKVLLKVT